MSAVHFCVDPTSHSHMVGMYILQGLERFFPCLARQTKQFYITQPTAKLIGCKTNCIHIRGVVATKLKQACIWFIVQH